jgi:hypothetical protein
MNSRRFTASASRACDGKGSTQGTAALRHFGQAYDRFGSIAPLIIRASRQRTSALLRKRTISRPPQLVRFVPLAAVSNRSKLRATRSPRRLLRARPVEL